VTLIQRYPSPGNVKDTCQQSKFFYDGNSPDTSFTVQYSANRPTAVEYGTPDSALSTVGSCAARPYGFSELYSYTQAGLDAAKTAGRER
jgi:hypothetical protein